MKKLLFLLVISFCFSFQSQAQDLTNTTWKVIDTAGTFIGNFFFRGDSLGTSKKTTDWDIFSAYTIIGNQISLKDEERPGGCDTSHVGVYDYTIKGDTLDFTYVDDSCYVRYLNVAVFIWLNLSTNIEDNENIETAFSVFPIPVSDRLFIENTGIEKVFNYRIIDFSGRQLLLGILNDEISSIDVSNFPAGNYFVLIGDNPRNRFQFIISRR